MKPLTYSQALLSGIWDPERTETIPARTAPCKLLVLPAELHTEIDSYLDIVSQLKFRLTNRHFYALFPPPTHATLLLAEDLIWAVARNLYSCMDCLRLRHQSKFASAMLKGPKGRNGKEPHKRFCVECGLKGSPKSKYSPGSEIVVEGSRFVLCKECRLYSSEVGCVGSGLCAECHTKIGCGEECKEKSVKRSRAPRARKREFAWDGGWEDMYEDLDDYDEYFWETHDPSD